ncbi:cyclic nucleotide-gated ion channel 1 [Citrus sinensis]|uniref:Cyclic nucleotide-gated ion channel 1 n=1 Tax=Citrus sinensis TaxID=2711 RepID=A0ACB8HR04_CITSI|nr:cyclic nucleotide-gated ion channel 1 [Citrus sinensis]
MPTWHQLRRRGLTTRQHMIDHMSSLDWITLLTRVSTKILKLACGAEVRSEVFKNFLKRPGTQARTVPTIAQICNGHRDIVHKFGFGFSTSSYFRCPHLSVCPSSPPFSGSGSSSRDSNRCIVANVGTYVSFNGSGKSVTVAILCSVKSITAAILCSGKSVTAVILCSGNSVTAAVLWDRVPAFWGTGIGLVYTSGRYIPLAGVPFWSVYACQRFPSGRFMLVPVFGSYHRLRSQHSNLEEGTPRLVAGVEMDSISRSEREATVSAFLTVIESLGNGVKTSLRQIRNLSRRFLEANFWLIYVYSMVFDPVFLYLPVTNDDKKCFQFDKDVMVCISRLPVFLFDLSIILPLPQVLVLLVYNRLMNVRKFFHVMNLFIVQHLVFGALWYFFALQRKTECWRKACTDSTKCRLLPLHCDNSLTNYTFSNDFCSTKTQNATIYDFGIFFDAINSGVIEQNNLFLSSFGQGLPFSTNVWENIFVISITITGVRLFFFLIGKVQYEMSKAEEIRQKVQEIYQWRPVEKLPEKLQMEIKEHQLSKVQETTGIDVEYLVNNLPEDLRKNIKQKLCLDLLKKVEEFGNWSDSSLETLCDVVKPVVFTERSYILQEGNPIDQMLFVLHDKLWTYTSRSIAGSSSNSGNPNNHLEDGDFSGEELIAWAKADRDSSNLPLSTKTIQALTKVEAFLLMADYLKQVLLDIDH